MARTKFPFVVKRGSVTVKIYFTPIKGFDSFTVAYWAGGKRVRKTYSTFKIAKAEAEIAANQLKNDDHRGKCSSYRQIHSVAVSLSFSGRISGKS